jgi:hypothetical protein
MRPTPSKPSSPTGKRTPVTGSAGPLEMFVPSTEVLGVGVGVGGAGVVTGATTGSSPTSVFSVEVLFARFGSASLAFTVAVLWAVPGSKGPVTTTVAVTEAPEGTEPRSHVTTPPVWVQLPCPELAETNCTPAGRVSVKVAAVPALGPALETRKL